MGNLVINLPSMKTLINLSLFAVFSLAIGCDSKPSATNNAKEIIIDTETAPDYYDISGLLEPAVDIILLETAPHCMITADSKVIVTPEYIIFGNQITDQILIFDSSGRHIQTVTKKGKGPGEYIELGDFALDGDVILIQDLQRDKIVRYSISDRTSEDFAFYPSVYYSALLYQGGKYNLLTDYSSADGHKYHNLIRMDKDNNRDAHIAYDKTISVNNQRWALDRHVGSYKDTALVIFSRNDTIYSVTHEQVCNSYVLNFKRHKMPAELLTKSGSEIYAESLRSGYNLGLDRINNSERYVVGNFWENFQNYTLIYDKTAGSVSLSSFVTFGDLGFMSLSENYITTDNNELVCVYDAPLMMELIAGALNHKFADSTNRAKFKSVLHSINTYSNPVLLKTRFK